MDNDKELFDGLLKADSIDPAGVSESERAVFKQMLDSEQKRMKRLCRRTNATLWMFVLVMLGLCLSENILEALHIPFSVCCFVLGIAMFYVMIRYIPGHNRMMKESGRKISKLYYLVHGKHRGIPLVGKKDGKRFIYWPRVITIAAVIWLAMSLGGAGVFYLLCGRWIYSSEPMLHIIYCTLPCLSLVIFVLRDGLKTPLDDLTEVKTKPKQSKPGSRSGVWRIIMRSSMTKFAGAAVIFIAVLIGVNQFGGSIDGASMAFADVRAAFLDQSWVHLRYDNDTESWYNLKTGDRGYKQLPTWGERFVYINRTDNLRQIYDPKHGKHINEDVPTLYKDGIITPYEPKTAWDRIIGHWEKIAENGESEYYDVEIQDDTLDGNSSVRFDIYYIDALNRKLLTKQFWADPLTKLPIKIRERLTTQQQKDQGREYITGVFSFPETGPDSIYDLGVPEDLPIARDYDNIIDPSIEEILEVAKKYYNNFPKRCRAVIWQNETGSSMIAVTWRDGEKVHLNHYSTARQVSTESPLDLPASLDVVLAWAETHPPTGIYIDDEKKSYSGSYHPAKARVTRSWRRGLPQSAHFIEEHWGYMEQPSRRFQFIDDAPEELEQYIGIRTESGTIRRDHYIDPEHDYIRVRHIWWILRNGQWEKEREYINIEMSQLPSGHWYVSKRKLIIYPNSEKGYGRGEYNYVIDIKLFDENEFPPDTFNGEKLLEGAEIETY